jgi:thymidylate synthase ThyX
MEITTTRAISAQIMRHRSFCLGANSQIWFDLPMRGKEDYKYKPFQRSISYLYDRWHNGAKPLPNGSVMPMQERIRNMRIRCMDEDTGEIIHTHINDITKSTAKLYEVEFSNGSIVTASMEHRFYTDVGWLTLKEAINKRAKFVGQSQKVNETPLQEFPSLSAGELANEEWVTVPEWEKYQVSNLGRVRRLGKGGGVSSKIRLGSISKSTGYPVISFNKPGKQIERNMQRIVLEAFEPLESYKGMEARHLNHNKLDCRLSNLKWGTSKDNHRDSMATDTLGRLRTSTYEIVNVTCVGEQDSYDISVDAPWHNFICDGMVVHNSFQELSQRYTQPSLVYPELRMKGSTNRQGSLDTKADDLCHEESIESINKAWETYDKLVKAGVALETARMVLPMCSETTIYMNGTLRSWIHYIQLRTEKHTQKEHRAIAMECQGILKDLYPNVMSIIDLTQ